MQESQLSVLDRVLQGYEQSYDIERSCTEPFTLPASASAAFHAVESGFALTRRAEMWSAATNEYVWFFETPVLTADALQAVTAEAWEKGLARIERDDQKNHMCTRICAVFICGKSGEDALRAVRKLRKTKNFKLALEGWAELQAVVLETDNERISANPAARDTARFLNAVLHPRRRTRSFDLVQILKRIFE